MHAMDLRPLQQAGGLFAAAFVIALTGAMAPGPFLTVTITETARHGRRAAFLLLAGHALLEAVLLVGFAFGLQTFLRAPARRHRRSRSSAGAFLLWMAVDLLARRAARHAVDRAGSRGGVGPPAAVRRDPARRAGQPEQPLLDAVVGDDRREARLRRAGDRAARRRRVLPRPRGGRRRVVRVHRAGGPLGAALPVGPRLPRAARRVRACCCWCSAAELPARRASARCRPAAR